MCNLRADERSDFDIVIRSGKVIDGTGAPWYFGDVGIEDGKITAVGQLSSSSAEIVIDAKGQFVAPGFIDMMGQTATPMFESPSTAKNLLLQGITTINAGEGSSEAPLDEARAAKVGWKTMAEYFQLLDLKGLPVNVVQTVGHTQVRQIVNGDENRRITPAKLQQMQQLVREAMEAGAIGVSTAIIYPPAVYADTQEIAAITSVAGEYGGRYYTHMRNEGDSLLSAIDEALEIGRQAKTPVHIYHLKAAGKKNWGKMQLAIAKIKAARADGQQVAADIYPYEFNGLGLEALIHPRHFTDGRKKFLRSLDDSTLRREIQREIEQTGGWENWYQLAGSDWNRIMIGKTASKKYANMLGMSVAEMADAAEENPWDTFFNLVQNNTFAMPKTMSEANIILAMQEDFVSFCTDVGPASSAVSVSHPRSHGAFPRLLSRFVRDLGVIPLEKAIAQATAVAANEVMAYDRGRIAIGQAADVIVFDLDQIADTATPANPRSMPTGMKHVIVNGRLVLHDGEFTNQRPGYVLRGSGFDRSKAASAVMTGKRDANLAAIDELMQSYLAENRAPGASLAISDNGRLVYSRGFGYADVATREKVQPTSLFRIASVSKPITAVAIMQLVEAGKLDLDTPVFSILDEYKPHLEPGAKVDSRLEAITIRHLLQHRGGWDRDVSFDGMFQSVRFANAMGAEAPAGHDEIIRCMMGVPLDFSPGKRYAYSNFGYCLLGRVIEKLTGMVYQDYVKQEVLKPLGITSMAIGATALSGRRDNEVRYYDSAVSHSVFADTLNARIPPPYGAWYLESMDSHGAWIASAIDLVRFADAFNKAEQSKLLKASSIKAMFQRPEGAAGFSDQGHPKPIYYGLGWQVVCEESDVQKYQRHGGSLPGTSTKLIRRSDGRNIALLFNARSTSKVNALAEAILDELNAEIDKMTPSEETDFYSTY